MFSEIGYVQGNWFLIISIFFSLIILVLLTLLLVLCSFTPYCYILGSGKEEVLGRGAGLLPEPKYIYIYIYTVACPEGG